MYLTGEQFTGITGRAAPDDFAVLEASARSSFDAAILMGLVGRDVSSLPDSVQGWIREAIAFQVMQLDENGISALNDGALASASVGRFSYSGGAAAARGELSVIAARNAVYVRAYLRGIGGGV